MGWCGEESLSNSVELEIIERCEGDMKNVGDKRKAREKIVKKKMLKKHGRVDYGKLRKEGYSERILARLENA